VKCAARYRPIQWMPVLYIKCFKRVFLY
jgi:hypothetical protein